MTSTQATARSVERIVKGMPTSDGAGVKLRRVIGQPVQSRVRIDQVGRRRGAPGRQTL